MIVNNFKKINLREKSLILKFKSKELKEIQFLEINKIYIKVLKVPFTYKLLLFGVSISAVLLLVWIFGFNLVVLSSLFLIFVGVVKLNNYKSCVLKIKLKDGSLIIQPIPLKLKYKTIEDIHKVRVAILDCFNPNLFSTKMV